MSFRFSVGVWMYSNAADIYCPEGYREPMKFAEVISAIAKVKTVGAVEIRQTDVTTEVPVREVKRILKDNGLVCSGVTTTLAHARRFALSGFGHQHQKTRNSAIDEGRKAVDIARALGTDTITLRLYTDGFDYPFHVDYTTHWNTVISSIKTIAKYATPDINVAIAYKPRECPAESIAFLSRSSKLFQIYFSDSYPMWDDMMIPGSVHLWETLEALFYLKAVRHKGFVTIDILPQRIEPTLALQIAAGNLSILTKKLEKLDTTEMRKAQKTLDATESQRIIRRVMLQG